MSMRTSAARYAKALLDIAVQESNPEQVEQELADFVEVVQQHADLERALGNPVVSAGDKRAIVEQVLQRLGPSSPTAKLLLLLAGRGRLALVPVVLDVYRERLQEHRQIVLAEVTTAEPLAPERATALQERLATMTGRTVTMTTRVNPEILGGVVTRIGSTVYDGSVATQLARVRDRLMERR
jgi:F-type H+-transporting ATPase subunit delta